MLPSQANVDIHNGIASLEHSPPIKQLDITTNRRIDASHCNVSAIPNHDVLKPDGGVASGEIKTGKGSGGRGKIVCEERKAGPERRKVNTRDTKSDERRSVRVMGV